MSYNVDNRLGASEAFRPDQEGAKNVLQTLNNKADKSITALQTTKGKKEVKSPSTSKKQEKPSSPMKPTFKAYAMQKLHLGKHGTKQTKNQILEFKFNDSKENKNLLQLEETIENKNKDTGQKGAYGGNLGNDYFNAYRDDIIMPGLMSHFKHLQSLPEGKLNTAESLDVYSKLITNLGQQRNIIATTTKTPQAQMFGCEGFGASEVITPKSFQAWHEHLMDHLSLNEVTKSDEFLKLEDGEKVKKIIEVLEKSPFLKDSAITTDSYGSLSFIHITPKDITIAPYKIIIEGANALRFQVNHTESQDSAPVTANHFFNALSSQVATEDDLKDSMARFYMHFNHTSVFFRGQAAVSSWMMQALAESHGFKLTFDEKWGGGEKRPDQEKMVSPDMHALSYHDENEFVEAFKIHAKLTPIENKLDQKK